MHRGTARRLSSAVVLALAATSLGTSALGTTAMGAPALGTSALGTTAMGAPALAAAAMGAQADSSQSDPARGERRHTLRGVDVASPSDAWTVGDSSPASGVYFTLARHWDGARWTTTPTPNPGASDNSLTAVADVAADDAWAVGEYYTGELSSDSLILHWDGSQWTQAQSESPGNGVNRFTEVDAISADDVYALGYSCDAGGAPETVGPQGDVPFFCPPLVEHWDGARWSSVSQQLADTDSISGVSDTDVYAAGTHVTGYPGTLQFRTKVSHFDGQRWRNLSVPNPGDRGSELTRILETAPDDVWALGYEMSADGYELKAITLHYDGSTWSILDQGAMRDVDFCLDLAGSSESDVWALCYGPNASLLHWDGTTWRAVPFPGDDAHPQLYDIAVGSATDAWLVGSLAKQGARLIRQLLHWDGHTWKRYRP